MGDEVILRGRVTNITAADDYCNCEVELERSMPPYKTPSRLSALNTRQLEKVNPEPEQVPATAEEVQAG